MKRLTFAFVGTLLSVVGCADVDDTSEPSSEIGVENAELQDGPASEDLGARSAGTASRPPHAAKDGPRYTADGKLKRPKDYREWVYLSSGLGMTYGPTQPEPGAPRFFDNVFVNRESYKHFLQTGTWLEKTIFVLEIRKSVQHASIDRAGDSQGEVVGLEAEVKDSSRFPNGGWGFFSLQDQTGPLPAGTAFPETAACYSCHRDNTAVENTFVQFYPTLMEVAERLGTVKDSYDPERKVE